MDRAIDAAPSTVDLAALTQADLLDQVRLRRADVRAAEVDLLELALEWAHAHPAWHDAPHPSHGEDEERAGWRREIEQGWLAPPAQGWLTPPDPDDDPRLPEVAWDAAAPLGAALGLSTTSARGMMRDALMLATHLPQLLARVRAGEVEVWRARRIAATAIHQPSDVVRHLDDVVTPLAHAIGVGKLDHLIEAAMKRLHAEEFELARAEAMSRRHVTVHPPYDGPSPTAEGLIELSITADERDARDFDVAVSRVAAALRHRALVDDDPETMGQSLDERRSRAIGILADPAQALALLDNPDEAPALSPDRPLAKAITLVVHVDQSALAGADPLARLDGSSRPLLAEQVAVWCGRRDHHVRVVPVIDLQQPTFSAGPQVTETMSRRVRLRHPTCVFPWCDRPSVGCDVDHLVPSAEGGATSDDNLLPLCRHHHRLKTFAGWSYRLRPGGIIEWTDPWGHRYHRDNRGTRDLDPPIPRAG